MAAPAPSERRQAELIARELALEAMKWLLRCDGDTLELSELGRAALVRSATDAERPPDPAPDRAGFVRDSEDRVWVSRAILRARGWTDTAIRDFLPDPEGRKTNPRFPDSGHPMPVWLPETVAEAEADERWQQWLQRSLRRRRTTMRALAETGGARFKGRLDAVQEAVEAYLQAKIARRSDRVEVRPG